MGISHNEVHPLLTSNAFVKGKLEFPLGGQWIFLTVRCPPARS
jgi:hypothetical protein